MKITVLTENTSSNPALKSEHGLSLFIETEKHNILFDSGQTDLFFENAQKLGVDLKSVDIAILSHGHYDHGGGLLKFFKINDKASVYINEHSFQKFLSGYEKDISIDTSIKDSDRVIVTGDFTKIDDDLTLCTCNQEKKNYFFDSFGLNTVLNGQIVPDTFLHEQYLTINENGKKIVFSGCSHKGILNIVDWLSPDVLIGGFHLKKLDTCGEDTEILNDVAKKLLSFNSTYYTCHCTGEKQYSYLKELMADRLNYMSTGCIIKL